MDDMPPRMPGGSTTDGCAEARATVEERCAASHAASAAHEAAAEHVRDLRRDLLAAQRRLEEATAAADPALRAAEKAAARDTYQLARASAEAQEALREATAVWAKALDRINRTASLRRREVAKARAAVSTLEAVLQASERDERTAKLRADQAEADCLDARVRLAACEEAQAPQPAPMADVFEPHAATGGHAVAISDSSAGAPLVIESIVTGDRVALELAAARMAESTGRSPAEEQLQLQELVDAIMSSAAEDGFLLFDSAHPFWSGLSIEESRDVIDALARLGFIFEPAEGWHAGRSPAPSDLSMALAYAGLDARNMRHLPSSDDLRALPASIRVDARAFLAARAPELSVDNTVRALGRRAEALEQLWNEWGQVRPILLSDRHTLGSVTG
ncbi:MAG: hypothetical protein AB1Z67_11890 [Candidatus Limnocylindrales bacterium]